MNDNDDKAIPCHKCGGTGFDKPGHICPHISGESYDFSNELLEGFADIFGGIFKDKK